MLKKERAKETQLKSNQYSYTILVDGIYEFHIFYLTVIFCNVILTSSAYSVTQRIPYACPVSSFKSRFSFKVVPLKVQWGSTVEIFCNKLQTCQIQNSRFS